MNNYTVYCHSNKTNGKRYVGITRNPVKHRWRNGTNYRGSVHFNNSINKYGWDGFTHFILADNLTEQEAINMEIEYIKKWKCTDQRYGYNMSDGGHIVSEEMKKNLSEKNKGVNNPNYGKVTSPETKEKISNSLKGKRCYHNMKKVEMYDIETNETLQVFSCIADAAKFNNVTTASLSRCCSGHTKQSNGKHFRFQDRRLP